MSAIKRRHVLEQGKGKTANNLYDVTFLAQLARLGPQPYISRLQNLPHRSSPFTRDHDLTLVASQLAIDDPGEAEQVFSFRDHQHDALLSPFYAPRLFRGLAQVDPTCARRVAASLSDPGTRAWAWAFVALGLANQDKAGVSEAIDRAIQDLDRLRNNGPGLEQSTKVGGVALMYATHPAVLLLPIVERVAPERLADIFWRAVALHPPINTNHANMFERSNIGYECMVLARYDRDVAAALFAPIDSELRTLSNREGPLNGLTSSFVTAMGCIDPRAAVAYVESLSLPRIRANRIPFMRHGSSSPHCWDCLPMLDGSGYAA